MKMYTNNQMTRKELLIHIFKTYGEIMEDIYEHKKDEEFIEVYYTIGNISYIQNITDQYSYLSHSNYFRNINVGNINNDLNYYDPLFEDNTAEIDFYTHTLKPIIENIIDSFLLKERLAEELQDNKDTVKKSKI